MRLLHAPLLALTVVLAAGCAGVEGMKPSVDSVSSRIDGIDLEGVDLMFDIGVRNPLPMNLKTPAMRYSFAVQGTQIASSNTGVKANLPGGRVGSVKIPVRIGYRELARIVGDLSGVAEANYAFEGAFDIPVLGSNITLPFRHQGTFPVVRPPSFSGVRVGTSGLSLSGGRVTIDATMTNPNAFGIDVAGLGYALRLGDVSLAGLSASTGGKVRAGASQGIRLTGEITAQDALRKLLGGGLGRARLKPTGSIGTPFGPLRLGR